MVPTCLLKLDDFFSGTEIDQKFENVPMVLVLELVPLKLGLQFLERIFVLLVTYSRE